MGWLGLDARNNPFFAPFQIDRSSARIRLDDDDNNNNNYYKQTVRNGENHKDGRNSSSSKKFIPIHHLMVIPEATDNTDNNLLGQSHCKNEIEEIAYLSHTINYVFENSYMYGDLGLGKRTDRMKNMLSA